MENATHDLMYLGWGERLFGVEPVALHSNGGWVYWAVTEGEILVEFTDHQRSFCAGTGMITGPDLAFGFPKQGQMPAKILAWIWKSAPPYFSDLSEDAYLGLSFSASDLTFLAQLHRQTRYECLHHERATASFLTHIHALLDIVFTRAEQGTAQEERPDQRIQMARQWMLDHLDASRPVEDLARYLSMSPVSLYRLFQERMQESPSSHFRRLKMERAQELLQRRQRSVKWVAYELGYRHPGDFSRAYSNFWGHAPSES